MDNRSIGSKIFRGTMIIVSVSILAKIASFLSEAILAAYLGTTYKSDAFYMVSSIKDVVYPMLSVGIWKVFLPVYKDKIARNQKEEADEIANKAISFFTVISIIVVIFVIFFAKWIVYIVAPGFKGETRELCIKLVKIAAPSYILIIASAVYAAMLQCHNKFLGSQIRQVASHIPVIIAAVFFYHRFGVYAMAFSLVVAGGLRLLIELPFVDWGYKYKFNFKFISPEFIEMLKRLPSALISEGVTQLNSLIDKAMASMLPEGTISGLNYGHKLMNVFSGLLSSAIATALYPQMIELIALEKKEELCRLVEKIINIFCIMMLPITLACILFRTELVSVVFQRGSFNTESVSLTAGVFAFYCIGLFFVASNTVVNNLFYSYGDTKTPMYISVVNLAINVILNILFISIWGVNGLAFATSMSAILTFFVRLVFVKKYVSIRLRVVVSTGVRVSIASILACGIPRVYFGVHAANPFLVLIASSIIGVLLYAICIKTFKVQEIDELMGLVLKKLNRNKAD